MNLRSLKQHLIEAAISKIVLDAQRIVEALSDIPDDEEEYDDEWDDEDMEDGELGDDD